MQTDVLRVIASVLTELCKSMEQLPTMLGPAVHHRKDTIHKILKTKWNACVWPYGGWESCAKGSKFVALHFGDHRTKEVLGVVGSKV